MAHKKRGDFTSSVGGSKDRQGMLFNIHEPEAVVLSDTAKEMLFDPKTQWSLHVGTTPSIGMGESMKRLQAGEKDIPVHDVKFHIALPLGVTKEQAADIVKEVIPDYDDGKNTMVFLRKDRLVSKQRVARGEETAWGKGDTQQQWVNGVSIETTDPMQVERFMAAARQAPKNFKIAVNYNEDWFDGTPPKPNERLKRVLDASGIDHGIFQKFRFAEKSSFAHETGLKDYLVAKSPAASQTVKP